MATNRLTVLLLSLFVPVIAFSQGAVPTLGNYGIFGNQNSARVSIFQNSGAYNGPSIVLGGSVEDFGAILLRSKEPSSSQTPLSHAFQVLNQSGSFIYNVGLISVNGKVWFGPQTLGTPSGFGNSSYSNLTLQASSGEGSWVTLAGTNNSGARNGIRFTGNDLNIFQSDDYSQGYVTPNETEVFSFYSKFDAIRNRNTELRVHGSTAWSDFGRFLSLSYVGGSNGYGLLSTDYGHLILSPGTANTPNANVGIRTTAPVATLQVNGTALIGQLAPAGDYAANGSTPYKFAVEGLGVFQAVAITEVSEWADFVFKPEYKLLDLKKVEAFIAQNGHLPDVPSEKEVRAKGYNVNEMDAKLLQKVEELTLYIIDLQKQIDALKQSK